MPNFPVNSHIISLCTYELIDILWVGESPANGSAITCGACEVCNQIKT